MPSGVYERPEPDAGMIARLESKGMVQIAPDREEIKEYIKKRLREGNMSMYRLAKGFCRDRGSLSAQLQPGISVSYDQLGRVLWVVDGNNCPYDFTRISDRTGIGGMTADEFMLRHPSAFIADYLQDEWKVVVDEKVYVYPKIDWSLKGALNDLDKKI